MKVCFVRPLILWYIVQVVVIPVAARVDGLFDGQRRRRRQHADFLTRVRLWYSRFRVRGINSCKMIV